MAESPCDRAITHFLTAHVKLFQAGLGPRELVPGPPSLLAKTLIIWSACLASARAV